MFRGRIVCGALAPVLISLGVSSAAVIDFDDGSVSGGSTLSSQYDFMGVRFSPGHSAVGVPAPPNGSAFASNTDLTVVDSADGDIGSGVEPPISGLMVHAFSGWLNEDGNPIFTMTFQTPVIEVSAVFGGNDLGDSVLCAVDPLGTVTSTAFVGPGLTDVATLQLVEPVSEVVVVLGAADDWVGFDGLSFTPVPEPSGLGTITLAMLALTRTSYRRRTWRPIGLSRVIEK